MSNDHKKADVNDRDAAENDANRRADTQRKSGQESQDALRHQQDAAHHKDQKKPQHGASK
jgi:hypothetical protein